MEHVSTLAEQVGAMADVVTRINREHRTRNRLMDDDAELMQQIVKDAGATVGRTARFLLPYVLRARDRGEVGRAVDAELASEWLARLIYSLLAVQSTSIVDLSDPATARNFLTTFAVDGLR